MGGGGSAPINTVDPVQTAIQMQTSCQGNPIPLAYGRCRVTGNILWYGDFTAVPHVTNNGGGGGKGGGGVTSSQTSWTYTASFVMALCEGQISGIPSMWAGKTREVIDQTVWSGLYGTYPQSTWPYMDSLHPSQSLNYPGIAYVSAANFNLDTDTSMPAFSFEVYGNFANAAYGYNGANPADIVYDLLTNTHYGAGFSSTKIGSLTSFQNYCGAMGLFLSPCYDTQDTLAQMLTDLMQILNTGVYFSEGVLKVVPYGDQNASGYGYTYTAPTSTLINLTDDDFIIGGSGDDPVQVKRNAVPTTANTTSDAFNQISLEYLNINNEFNTEICTVQDQVSIDTFGLIPMDQITAHQITDPNAAYSAASLILARSVYIRNQYIFNLGWNYAYLEPTDIVTITDTALGLNLKPVRILIVEEDDTGTLAITAEDAPPGAASRVQATPGGSTGYTANYNIAPGSVFTPAFFEPPVADVAGTSGIEVWIAVTGKAGTAWGGCNIWASNDGNSYNQIGQATTPSRVGHLTAGMLSGDTSLAVLLDGLGGQLTSGSATDAANMSTLLAILTPGIPPEFIAYQGASLTGSNAYALSGLLRGCYNSAATAHNVGDIVVRVDGAIAKGNPLDLTMMGKPLYFKFQSFNIYGAATEQLANVPAYQYTVTGSALKAPMANVNNLIVTWRGQLAMLAWDSVTDPVRAVDYEIRKGTAWATAQVLGRTPTTTIAADGDGTYWVAAHCPYAYSASPSSVVIVGSSITKNIVATIDEFGTGLLGTFSGGATIVNGNVELAGASNFSTISQLSTQPDVAFFGGVSPSGYYQIPTAHEVDLGFSQICNLSIAYTARADNPYSLFSTIADVKAAASIAGNYSGQAGLRMQVALSDNTGTYGAWQDFTPGSYTARKIRFRAYLYSNDPSVVAILTSFVFTVDVPDRTDKGTGISVPAGGLSITYATPFQVAPNLQVTIVSGSQGDDVILTAQTKSGATIQILNGGIGVARTVNWLAAAY